jgi:hypothetical protein
MRGVSVPKKHKLGVGIGSIVEYEDGTAGFVPSMSLTQAFRVKISDITGFSVAKGGKMLERQLNVLGNGTLLGAANVNHGAAEKIENWFRTHPDFGKNQTAATAATTRGPSVADELAKLGDLHAQGILTAEEFAAAKARLIGT